MVYYRKISDTVNSIKNKYRETDPFKLCEEMSIILMPKCWGTDEDCIKGFFVTQNKCKLIAYNSDLPEPMQNMIIFHEIGHSVLHSDRNASGFSDVLMFDKNSVTENEANLFAAEYMLSDEEVLEVLDENITFFTAAAMLNVPYELLDFKFRIMKWKGYPIKDAPVISRSNFLKNINIPHSFN